MFANYEKAYYVREYGVLGEPEWDRYESSAYGWYDRIGITVWESIQNGFTTQFLAHIEQS